MRRVVVGLFTIVAGTTVLVGLKAPDMATLTRSVADAPLDPTPLAKPGTTGKPGAVVKPTSKPGTTSTKTTTATRTVLGTAYAAVWEGENFGSMQVKIVVTGTHIDSVIAVRQSNRPRNVASVLGTRAISIQSANVGNVSGATASSEAYRRSLQSAISKI